MLKRWLLAMTVSGCAGAPVAHVSYADAFGPVAPPPAATARAPSKVVISKPKAVAVRPSSFSWPVDPVVVTSGFGHRFHPMTGGYQRHAGIDLLAEPAQPVYAAYAGTVTHAGWNGAHGKQVELRHDKQWSTSYSHLDTWLVKKGQQVKKGQLLGLAGSTGQSTGVHVHFELHQAGAPIDPEGQLPPIADRMMVSTRE